MNRAFTLAEVLITLGIIGIVAALTLPNLIEEHQKKETSVKLQKMYSTLNQVIQKYSADNETPIDNFNTSLSEKDFMEEYFAPYLHIVKRCSTVEECWGTNSPKTLDGKTVITPKYSIILSSGEIIGLSKHYGMIIYYDINGAKGYNKSGRDIFNFYLIGEKQDITCGVTNFQNYMKSGLHPGGHVDCYMPFDRFTIKQLLGTSGERFCNKNAPRLTGYEGDACAAVIMLNNWQIPKEYPW